MRTFWDKVKGRLWRRMDWYSCDLTHWAKPYGEKTDFNIRQMRQDDLDKLFQKFPEELDEIKYHILKERITEEERKVFVAETSNDNTPAGYFCTSVTDTFVGETKRMLSVPKGTVYLFDGYVFEQYRGQRIQQKSICYRMQQYRDLGYTEAIVCIDNTNDASFHSYKRCGFEYSHSDIYVIPLGFAFTKTFLKQR